MNESFYAVVHCINVCHGKVVCAYIHDIVYISVYRDFVSVRQIAAVDGCYYSASQATTTTLKPEQPGKVRYIVSVSALILA